jgi:hypothetical protein
MEKQPLLLSLKECYNEYKQEVLSRITKEQLEDAVLQTQINQALGTDPPS